MHQNLNIKILCFYKFIQFITISFTLDLLVFIDDIVLPMLDQTVLLIVVNKILSKNFQTKILYCLFITVGNSMNNGKGEDPISWVNPTTFL